MNEHTKEPWRVELSWITGSDGKRITCPTACMSRDDDENEANERRIVACVNACAGIANPDDYEFAKLLRLADEQRMACLTYERENAKQAEMLNSVVQQRDELLAALKRLWVACPTGLECRSFHHAKQDRHGSAEDCKPAAEYLAAIEQANAAIAKVKP